MTDRTGLKWSRKPRICRKPRIWQEDIWIDMLYLSQSWFFILRPNKNILSSFFIQKQYHKHKSTVLGIGFLLPTMLGLRFNYPLLCFKNHMFEFFLYSWWYYTSGSPIVPINYILKFLEWVFKKTALIQNMFAKIMCS